MLKVVGKVLKIKRNMFKARTCFFSKWNISLKKLTNFISCLTQQKLMFIFATKANVLKKKLILNFTKFYTMYYLENVLIANFYKFYNNLVVELFNFK